MNEILEEIKRAAECRNLPIINSKRGNFLKLVTASCKPKRVLEVGTLVGYSAILMAQQMSPNSQIISIEKDEKKAHEAQQNINHAGFNGQIILLIGDAKKIIPKLEGEFDLLFLDGVKKEYLTYFKLAKSKLSKNAIVVSDNVKKFESSMSNFLRYIRYNNEYESKTYTFDDDAIEISRRIPAQR